MIVFVLPEEKGKHNETERLQVQNINLITLVLLPHQDSEGKLQQIGSVQKIILFLFFPFF